MATRWLPRLLPRAARAASVAPRAPVPLARAWTRSGALRSVRDGIGLLLTGSVRFWGSEAAAAPRAIVPVRCLSTSERAGTEEGEPKSIALSVRDERGLEEDEGLMAT